jgi:hypothetical protein
VESNSDFDNEVLRACLWEKSKILLQEKRTVVYSEDWMSLVDVLGYK